MDAQGARGGGGESLGGQRARSEWWWACTGFVEDGGSWPRYRIVALGREIYLHVQAVRGSTTAGGCDINDPARFVRESTPGGIWLRGIAGAGDRSRCRFSDQAQVEAIGGCVLSRAVAGVLKAFLFSRSPNRQT
jgi:hypothetical protein